MKLIREIVQEAENIGYLTLEAENQLRQLLTNKYEREDFTAFIQLQKSVMEERVKQESRELFCRLGSCQFCPEVYPSCTYSRVRGQAIMV